ncbi:uncharacterized protein, partial [Mycetomoellerius zeteki]|uniref:uncharacterized protein n=1 Tax=Mycetomoellerius zeteki TaxID=64791 RepID=UPI00084EC590
MAQKWVFAEWRARLEKAEHGAWTVGAVRPCLEEWAGRRWGELTYQLTQVLTGCFGEYLHRIGKERSPHCHHCDADEDTAQHTIAECSAWDAERDVLVQQVGGDLSLPALIREMLRREASWKAASGFCERVMLQKEEAEW